MSSKARRASAASVIIGQGGARAIVIGPLRTNPAWPNFLFGPIEVVTEYSGSRITRETGNGIDRLRLGHLRDDLRRLHESGSGSCYVGDHDSYDVVTFVDDGNGNVSVVFSDPSLDLWEMPVTTISVDDLRSLVRQIDAVERDLGPLTGFCDGCGEPRATYRP